MTSPKAAGKYSQTARGRAPESSVWGPGVLGGPEVLGFIWSVSALADNILNHEIKKVPSPGISISSQGEETPPC